MWVETLDFWQGIQDFVHNPTSRDIPGQTNLDEINLLDALTPGWDTPCSCSNSLRRSWRGTRGRREPVEISHRTSPELRGWTITDREGFDFISCTDEQAIWNLDKLEASKPSNTGLLEGSPPGAGTKADVKSFLSLVRNTVGKELETSVVSDTSDTTGGKEPGAGKAWGLTGLDGDWKELGAGFKLEQGLVGLGEIEDGFDSGFGEELGETGCQLQHCLCQEYEQWS